MNNINRTYFLGHTFVNQWYLNQKKRKDENGFSHFQSENDSGLFQTDNSYHRNKMNTKEREDTKSPLAS